MRRWLQRAVLMVAATLAALMAARVGLTYAVNMERDVAMRLKQVQAREAAAGVALAEARARRDRFAKTLELLDALRGGGVASVMRLLDGSLTSNVWFQSLAHLRVGEPGTPIAAGAAVPIGGTRGDRPLNSQERLDIRGYARDHAALTDFLARLRAQPGVAQVRLIDSSTRDYVDARVVDFQVEVSLGPAHRSPA